MVIQKNQSKKTKEKIVELEKNLETLENSSVKLSIKVPSSEIEKEYNNLVNEYCKTVQIKGFRKGKVPPQVLIRKFGPALLEETAEKIIEKSITEALEDIEKKPISYATPEVKTEDKLELGKDFSFDLIYDVFPEVEVGEYKGIEVEELETKVMAADIKKELELLQDQNSIVVDKKDGIVDKDSIVTVDFVELDTEGNEIPNTKRESFVFQVGSGYNIYKIDDDIIGMKKDEEKVIKKKYPEDFEHKELAGKEVALKVKVQAVKKKELPKIDDELAQDISDKYQTLEDLKKDIKKKLKELAESRIKSNKLEQIIKKIVENSKVPLPKSMIDFELETRWRNFVAQLRADEQTIINMLKAEGKTKEDLFNEWRPSTEQGLREALVVREILKKENIQVTDDEIEAEIKKEAEANNMSYEELKERVEKGNLKDSLKDDIAKQKLFDMLLENAVVTGKKKVKFMDLKEGNY